MSQITGKWIADGAITPPKMDATANYTFGSVHVTGDATVDGFLQISSIDIDKTTDTPAIIVNTIGNAPAVEISTTRQPAISIDSTASAPSISITNTLINSQGMLINLPNSNSQGIIINGQSGAFTQGIVISGCNGFPGSFGVQSDGTSQFSAISTDTISPITTEIDILGDTSVTGNFGVAGQALISESIDNGILSCTVLNTGVDSIGTGAAFYATVADHTIGVQYAGDSPPFRSVRIGSFSDDDVNIMRDNDMLHSLLITTDADNNPMLNDQCPTTLMKDVTANGNLTVTQFAAFNTVYGIIENLASGPNTGVELDLIAVDATVGMKYISGSGQPSKVGTFSDPNLTQSDLELVRGDAGAVRFTLDGDGDPQMNVICPTTMLNDVTSSGNNQTLGNIVGNTVAALSGALTLQTGAFPPFNKIVINPGNNSINLSTYVGGGTIFASGDTSVTGNMMVSNENDGGILYSVVENTGTGTGTGVEFNVFASDATVGMRYVSGPGAYSQIGTFSDPSLTQSNLKIVRGGDSAVTITLDGNNDPQLNVQCPTTFLNDATANGNIYASNFRTYTGAFAVSPGTFRAQIPLSSLAGDLTKDNTMLIALRIKESTGSFYYTGSNVRCNGAIVSSFWVLINDFPGVSDHCIDIFSLDNDSGSDRVDLSGLAWDLILARLF